MWRHAAGRGLASGRHEHGKPAEQALREKQVFKSFDGTVPSVVDELKARAIAKRRRAELGFLGATAIHAHLTHDPHRIRVGIRPDGRAPARAGTTIAATDATEAGAIPSGVYGATLGAPIAMGYVRRDLATDGTPLALLVRGQHLPAAVTKLPFVAHRFAK